MFKKKRKEVYLHIDRENCTGCGRCVARCRNGALELMAKQEGFCARRTDPDACSGCGRCLKACPARAIDMAILLLSAPIPIG